MYVKAYVCNHRRLFILLLAYRPISSTIFIRPYRSIFSSHGIICPYTYFLPVNLHVIIHFFLSESSISQCLHLLHSLVVFMFKHLTSIKLLYILSKTFEHQLLSDWCCPHMDKTYLLGYLHISHLPWHRT
jgi:hypothetical protein